MSATYRIGDASITRIPETMLTSLEAATLFPGLAAAGLSERERTLLFGDEHAQTSTALLNIHSWLVRHDGRVILIDTGIGNGRDRPFSPLFHQLQNPFLERLQAAGVSPEQVDYVLMTHLHVDHVGWNTRRVDGKWVPTFPNATYVFPEVERDFFFTPAGEGRRMVFEDSVLPVIEAGQAETIGPDGGQYLEDFTFLPTPGHSVGHMSISLKSGRHTALFSGDVMHNPLQVHRPELGSVFCADPVLARTSREWLLSLAADREATLFTAHFPQTSAGKVTHVADGYGWTYL